MKLALSAVLVAAIGCTNSPSVLETVTVAAKPNEAPAPSANDRDERLARLERRLDKVVAALDQALGRPNRIRHRCMPCRSTSRIRSRGRATPRSRSSRAMNSCVPYCLMVNPVVEQIRASIRTMCAWSRSTS